MAKTSKSTKPSLVTKPTRRPSATNRMKVGRDCRLSKISKTIELNGISRNGPILEAELICQILHFNEINTVVLSLVRATCEIIEIIIISSPFV